MLDLHARQKIIKQFSYVKSKDIEIEIRNKEQLDFIVKSLKKNDWAKIESEALKNWLGNVAVKLLFLMKIMIILSLIQCI